MYSAELVVNSPRMATGVFRCNDCKMMFNNQALLSKHKSKFCVGGTGDPDDLMLRRGLRSDSPPRYATPDDRSPTESKVVDAKVVQLKKLKKDRALKRELQDLEERMLLDQLEDMDRKTQKSPVRQSRNRLPLSKHQEIRELQIEYEKLREKENDVRASRPVRTPVRRQTPYSRNSNSSMTIRLDDDYRRYNPNADQQLRNLAETHGRQMEYLQLRNKDLEKQREEIRQKLEGLGKRSLNPGRDSTTDLLQELKAQEERNQRALEDLKRQLWEINRGQKVNIVEFELLTRNIGKSVNLVSKIEEMVRQWGNWPTGDDTKDKTTAQKIQKDTGTKTKREPVTSGSANQDRESVISQSSLQSKHSLQSLDRRQNEKQTAIKNDSGFSESDAGKGFGHKDGIGTAAIPYEGRTMEELMELMREKKIEIESVKLKLKPGVTNRHLSEVEKPVFQPPPPPPPPAPAPPPPAPEPPKRNFVYPVYYGNSLVAEICAIRQAYLQNGGNDPDILSQLSQMQADAQAIEDQMKNPPPEKPPKEKKPDNTAQFQVLEMENQRLMRELELLQEKRLQDQNRQHQSDREDELERDLKRLHLDHQRKMYGLQRDIDELRFLLALERNRPPQIQQPQQVTIQGPQPPVSLKPYVEVEPMAPYDQLAGFVIFYDFLLSLDPGIRACRLIVGLHSSSAVMGEPTVLPTVYTEPATRGEKYNYNYTNAVIGAKQPVPKCPPDPDLGIVAELQAAGGPASEHDNSTLITRAWAKIPLFDNSGRLIAGRFRIPMRNVPIKPFMHVSQIQRIPKYGEAELYYRVVDMRQAEIHSMQQISAANYSQYMYPQILTGPGTTPNIPPPPSVTPPKVKTPSAPRPQPSPEQRLPSIQTRAKASTSPPQVLQLQDMTLGFQVDRVKRAEPGEGKIRLTAYYASTGKVVQSTTSPVTCSTTAVRSNFKYGYHVFGQQEAMFQEVDVQGDMILIARFYLRKRQPDVDDFMMPEQTVQESSLYDEETLVAWSAVPLVLSSENVATKRRRNFNPNTMSINQGTHTIPLYQPPVPEPSRIPFDDQPYSRDWQRYGKATLRIYIFQGQPRPGSLTPSDLSDNEEDTLPEFAWLPLERKTFLKEPYLMGDGFDIYIDGCRYLPDSVTFSKVAGRILDRRYEVSGKDINTGIKLDSDIYNPVYEHKTEFRDTSIPPTATLLLKIYTVDNFYKTLTVVGYATLNIFVETGTEKQPVVDRPMQVSLNEGAHQLRMYAQGPNGVDPLSESCLRDAGIRIIPCASVLVRVVKISRSVGGKALESSKIPQNDWLRMGLWQPRPKYTDRIYLSSKCMPTKGETRLFHAMMRRTKRSVREVIALVASAKESFLRSDKNMEEYIRNQLTKAPDIKPLDQDLNFICQYSPKSGIKVAVDSAVNLPWSNFTHAHMCLNPPAAFYLGAPHATYDKLTFTENLDLRSTNTSPAWKDGFKHFPRRSYHRFLTLIIHLQEISVSVAKDNYKYGLLEQAWTCVQIFNDKYANTMAYQLPMFAGSPTQNMLKQLAREPCKEWMERNIRNNGIQLLEGTSMFVRLADARRDDELASDIANNKLVEVNTDYIPVGLEAEYSRERPGKPLETIIPLGKTPEQFVDNLKTKFKSLVYKLYEEGNVSK